ncbi:MAG TPA: NAD-dependent epimerase/dehydratase family protein, partial [Actinomycetota bacterium]|nr:NAD-dependent epimerase/dehydratase family protein [Actinomycetota bacterium]
MTGRVLVTGGSGVVGRAVLERLRADHREIVALVRSGASAETVRALGASPVRGDVLDARSVRDAADGCETVFHVAGVNAMCRRDPSALYETNVDG